MLCYLHFTRLQQNVTKLSIAINIEFVCFVSRRNISRRTTNMKTSVTQEMPSGDGWSNAEKTSKFFDFSVHTLKVYRKKHWILGIHYQYLNSRTIRYNIKLIQDWLVNLGDPQSHKRGIEVHLASLPSNQSKKRR